MADAPAWLHDGRDKLSASDPGLARLRTATKAVVAVASALAVEWVFATATGQSTLMAMLMGTVVAMMSSMALSDPTVRGKAITAVFIPVAVAIGMVPGTATESHHELTLVVFVVMMFFAVFVRRFGVRFFFYGFLAWMGYFFSVFLKAGWAALPTLLEAVVLATFWVFLLSVTVLRDRPDLTLRRTVDAFWVRGRQIADAADDVVAAPASQRARRALHRTLVRVTETALLVDGHLGAAESGPGGRSLTAVRGWLVDAELAFDAIATSSAHLADAAVGHPAAVPSGVRQVLRAVGAGDLDEARAVGAELQDVTGGSAVHRLVAAVDLLASIRAGWQHLPEQVSEPAHDDQRFESAVDLFGGNLPGSAAVASAMTQERTHRRLNPLRLLDLTTRQAVQVAIAAALAIVVGSALDQQRYYWAVIAAFVVFTGTSTGAETARKAMARVAGTLLGLVVAIVLAEATAGHTVWALLLVLVSIFSGFYLQRLSYGAMIFFITIMLGQLYSMLHQFSPGLLVLRLEETVIGAVLGVGVSFLVLPTSTRATARTALTELFGAMADLLEHLGARVREPSPSTERLAGQARTMDAAHRQYLNIARPLTWSQLWRSDTPPLRLRGMLLTRAVNDIKHLTQTTAAPHPCATGIALALHHLSAAFRALGDPASPSAAEEQARTHAAAAKRELGELMPDATHDRLDHLQGVLGRLLGSVPDVSGVRRSAGRQRGQ